MGPVFVLHHYRLPPASSNLKSSSVNNTIGSAPYLSEPDDLLLCIGRSELRGRRIGSRFPSGISIGVVVEMPN